MKIYFSSATIQAYENKDKAMDIFFNPIMIFEGYPEFSLEQLKDIKWKIESEKIGTHEFSIQMIQHPSIENTEKENFIEFRLSKKDVLFIYDNYSCKITFEASIEYLDKEDVKLYSETLAIVKTKWSKGLI